MIPDDEANARALQRWLESPAGTPPPPELDPDVAEAIYALQPDRAPAPKVTVDDLLAGITDGPLADRGASRAATGSRAERGADVGEVVPFPSPAGPPAPRDVDGDPARGPGRGGHLRWVGGASGLALLAAAAASVLLLVVPPEPAEQAEPIGLAVPREAPSPAASPAEPQLTPERSEADAEAKGSTSSARSAGPARPPFESPAAALSPPMDLPAAPEVVAQEEVYEIQDDAALRDRASIPELVSKPTADATDRIAGLDEALAEASGLAAEGDPHAAGDRLASWVKPPADVGQRAALAAARYYLQANSAREAERIAKRGLELSATPSAQRTELERVHDLARQRR